MKISSISIKSFLILSQLESRLSIFHNFYIIFMIYVNNYEQLSFIVNYTRNINIYFYKIINFSILISEKYCVGQIMDVTNGDRHYSLYHFDENNEVLLRDQVWRQLAAYYQMYTNKIDLAFDITGTTMQALSLPLSAVWMHLRDCM